MPCGEAISNATDLVDGNRFSARAALFEGLPDSQFGVVPWLQRIHRKYHGSFSNYVVNGPIANAGVLANGIPQVVANIVCPLLLGAFKTAICDFVVDASANHSIGLEYPQSIRNKPEQDIVDHCRPDACAGDSLQDADDERHTGDW